MLVLWCWHAVLQELLRETGEHHLETNRRSGTLEFAEDYVLLIQCSLDVKQNGMSSTINKSKKPYGLCTYAARCVQSNIGVPAMEVED